MHTETKIRELSGRESPQKRPIWRRAWSRDPPRFTRRHPPHHLSPAWAKHPAGTDLSASRVLLWHEGSRDPTYVTGPWRPAPFSHRNDRCEPDNRRCDNHAPFRHRGSTPPGPVTKKSRKMKQ